MKYYVIGVYGDVKPMLYGPYDTEDERLAKARELRNSEELDEGGVYRLDIDANGSPSVESFSGIELEQEEDEPEG